MDPDIKTTPKKSKSKHKKPKQNVYYLSVYMSGPLFAEVIMDVQNGLAQNLSQRVVGILTNFYESQGRFKLTPNELSKILPPPRKKSEFIGKTIGE
jgi:hypothetical protein